MALTSPPSALASRLEGWSCSLRGVPQLQEESPAFSFPDVLRGINWARRPAPAAFFAKVPDQKLGPESLQVEVRAAARPPHIMDIPAQLSFALYAAAFTLGLPLNVILLSEAVSHARLRLTPSLVYTLHLACSDLLLTASLPLKAAEALAGGAWPLPASLCPAFALIHFVPLYSGGVFLTALSAGRYLGAAFPLGYQAARRPCYSWGVCVGIWGLVLFHLGLVLGLETLGGQVDNSTKSLGLTIPINGSPVCLEAWDPIWAGPARLSVSLLLFFLPLAITAFCYVGCLRALARSGLSRSRKLRAARVAGGALLTLLLCLGPYNASHVLGFVKPDAGGHWRKLGLIMGSWSTVLNPLVSGCLGNRAGQRHGTIGTPGGTAQK